MRFSKSFHLLVTCLFFLQSSLPALSFADATSVVGSASTEPSNEALTSIIIESTLLAKLASEMNEPLAALHDRYLIQAKYWKKALSVHKQTISEHDDSASLVGRTIVLLQMFVSYAESFVDKRCELVKSMDAAPLGSIEKQQAVTQLYPVLLLEEKAYLYELTFQAEVARLHALLHASLQGQRHEKLRKQLDDFESFRKQQVRQFIHVYAKFQKVKEAFALLRKESNATQFAAFSDQIDHTAQLTERFANAQQKASSQRQPLIKELEQLTAEQEADLSALLSSMTAGQMGISRPVFYDAAHARGKEPASQKFSPARFLSLLQARRPALQELIDLLSDRNFLLINIPGLEASDRAWLNYQLGNQALKLKKIVTALAEIDSLNGPNKDKSIRRRMELWEVVGIGREIVISADALILNELNRLDSIEKISSTPDWKKLRNLLHRQQEWRDRYQQHNRAWLQAIEDFKRYQIELPKQAVAAITTIRKDLKRLSAKKVRPAESNINDFFDLLDRSLAERHEQLTNLLKQQQAVMNQEQSDPLFGHFFGINPDRFLCDFKGMGIGLSDIQQLVHNASRIRSDLLALSLPQKDQWRQAFLVLRLSRKLAVIDQIAANDQNCTVYLRGGTRFMMLEGCGSDHLPQLRAGTNTVDRFHPPSLLQRISSMLTIVPVAHAGIVEWGSQFGGKVVKQVKNNWFSYAITGVVAVGAVAAAPIAAAAGATAATVTAFGVGATTILAGTKSAFVSQACADVAIATSRQAVDDIFSNNKHSELNGELYTKDDFHKAINIVENAYNIGKMVEGAKNLFFKTEGIKGIQKSINYTDETINATYIRSTNAFNESKSLRASAQEIKNLLASTKASGGTKTLEGLNKIQKYGSRLNTLSTEIDNAERVATEASELVSKLLGQKRQLYNTFHESIGTLIADLAGEASSMISVYNGVVSDTPDDNEIVVPCGNTVADDIVQEIVFPYGNTAAATQTVGSIDSLKYAENGLVSWGTSPLSTNASLLSAGTSSVFEIATDRWNASALAQTNAERAAAAAENQAEAQLHASKQQQLALYQAAQNASQHESAESMGEIERRQSTQFLDAVVSGLTSGVTTGVSIFGERLGQGAGVRLSQELGLIKKDDSKDSSDSGHCHSDSDCPTGSTCQNETCSTGEEKETSETTTYSGSWSGQSNCTANYGNRGTASCPWKGTMRLTFQSNGSVSGTLSGGAYFNWDEQGNFQSCSGASLSATVSGSHANGSFTASSSGGSSITGKYSGTSVSGSMSKSSSSTLANGETMSCRSSGSINLSGGSTETKKNNNQSKNQGTVTPATMQQIGGK